MQEPGKSLKLPSRNGGLCMFYLTFFATLLNKSCSLGLPCPKVVSEEDSNNQDNFYDPSM